MLRVDVTLIPGGHHARSEKLKSIYIWNISDLADVSDYDALLLSGKAGVVDPAGAIRVTGHNREDGCLVLVEKTLAALRERLTSTAQTAGPGVDSDTDSPALTASTA